jgi:hypothetical protein
MILLIRFGVLEYWSDGVMDTFPSLNPFFHHFIIHELLALSLFTRICLNEKGHAIRELGHPPQKQAPFGDKHGIPHFSPLNGIDGMAHKG